MTITRALSCAAILSFLALPVIIYLGRPTPAVVSRRRGEIWS